MDNNRDIKLLSQHVELLKKHGLLTGQLNLALTCLIRIRTCYPHIFSECVTQDDIDKLTVK